MQGSSPATTPRQRASPPNKRAPEAPAPGALSNLPAGRLGVVGFGFDGLRRRGPVAAADTVMLRLRSADVDLLGLHRLGDLAHQLDREQAVLEVRAPDLDMVGKREAPLERTRRDPTVDVIAALLVVLLALAAGDDEHILL